jgi:GNAT superfamily N-acetyltransferase
MIAYARETLFDVVEEVDGLLRLHYEELTLNRDRIALQPRWASYRALEAAGNFVLFTAREDGQLIGYSAFFIDQHMHYVGLTLATNDVLFLHPDYRTGRTGVRLIRFCEQELAKQLPEFKLVWHAKYSNYFAQILEKMDYAREEVMMARMFPATHKGGV